LCAATSTPVVTSHHTKCVGDATDCVDASGAFLVSIALMFSTTTANAASAGDKRAVQTAHQYLGSSYFSLLGLVDQLKFEGYTVEQATYGASHSGANWNSQAVGSAKDYLSNQAFSQGGLIAQLVFEKFTQAQATYGVSKCGANWNYQAVLAAKEYLSTQSFSRSGLIAQLEFDKFTAAQATYGVNRAY